MKSKTEPKYVPKGKRIPVKEKQNDTDQWKITIALVSLIALSFISYLPVFHNTLLNWDDEGYIKHNVIVHTFNIKDIFTRYVMGNYHPFTMLVYAIEYQFFGLNPIGYHSINLLLHLINVILVFYTVRHWSDKTGVALIASLLFGIHPLHVESVAWAAELKDLLYTLFFLASLISYMQYFKTSDKKFYFLSLLFFFISLLSKAMAASLPLVLILFDYFKERGINLKIVKEKIPFFLLALIFGIVAIYAQRSSGSILNTNVITLPYRFVFASYGFVSYLLKLFMPLHLCAFYPYPVSNGGVYIPGIHYACLVALLFLIIVVILSVRYSKKIIFGLGFFTLTILLVLQLLPVGKAIMADRYGYIPSIGIFFLFGEGILFLWKKNLRIPVILLLLLVTVLLPLKTFSRCGVWKNDLIFWSDVIDQYQTIEEAYYNRGIIHMNENRPTEALNDYNKALELKPDYSNAYNNKGLLLMNLKRYDESIQLFNKAIESYPGNADAYYNRGTVFQNQNKNKEAISDFSKAIEINPEYSEAYNNRGSVFFSEKRNEEALRDFSKALELNPSNAEACYNTGVLFMNERKNSEALLHFNKAIHLKPDYINAFNNRAIVFADEKNYLEALNDFTRIIELQPANFNAFNNRGMIYMNLKNNAEAYKDFNQAIRLNPGFAPAYNNMANLFFEEKKYEQAISLYTSVIKLLNNYPQAWYKRGLAEYYSGKGAAACQDIRQAVSMGSQQAKEILSVVCK